MASPFDQFRKSPQESASPFDEFRKKPDPFAEFRKPTEPEQAASEAEGGWIETATFSDAELNALARKFGVDQEQLKQKSGWVGAKREQQTTGEVGKRAAEFGSSILFGLPTKGFIASESDPKMRAALDEVRSLAEDKKSTAQSAAEIGAGFLIPVGGIAKGTASVGKMALEGAGYGALGGLGYSKEGEELSGAGFGAGLGAGVGAAAQPVIKGVGKILSKKEPALTEATAEAVAKEEKAFPSLASTVEEDMAKNEGNLSQELQKKLDDAEIDIRKPIEEGSLNEQKWQNIYQEEALKQEPIPLDERSVVKKGVEAVNYRLGDARPIFEDMDRKTGGKLNAARAQDDLSIGLQKVERTLTSELEDGKTNKYLSNLVDQSNQMVAKYFKGSEDAFGSWLRAYKYDRVPESVSKLLENPEFRQDLTAYGEKMNALRVRQGELAAKEFGIDMNDKEKVASFVSQFIQRHDRAYHETVAEPVSIVRRLQDTLTTVFGKDVVPEFLTTGKLPKDVKVLDPEALQKLKQVVDYLQDRPKAAAGEQVSLQDIKPTDWNAIRGLFNINKLENATSNIRNTAALKAADQIPELLLETNPERQIMHLANVVNKATYLAKPIEAMQSVSRKLQILGKKEASDYVAEIVQDVQGGRVGTFAQRMQDLATQYKADFLLAADRARRDGRNVHAKLLEFTAEAPDLASFLMRQAYPNFLGMSVKANILNSMQTLALTLPELAKGNIVSYTRLMMGGLRAAARDLKAGDTGGVISHARSLGLTKGERPESLKRLMRSEFVKQNRTLELTGDAIDKATNLAMKFFEFSEAANRTFTRGIATHIVESGQALKYLHILPEGYKKQVQTLSAELSRRPGDAQIANELQDIYQRQLISGTMFNYDKATASRFVREMGPIFGMFTKWPSSIAGKMANSYLEGGVTGFTKHTGTVYLAPLAALSGLQMAIDSGMDWDEDSLRREALVGKEGLASAAPIQSAKGLLSGEMFSPPAYSTTKQVVTGLAGAATGEAPEEEVPKAALKAAADIYRSFGPLGWVVRILTKDAPKFMDISADLAKPE